MTAMPSPRHSVPNLITAPKFLTPTARRFRFGHAISKTKFTCNSSTASESPDHPAPFAALSTPVYSLSTSDSAGGQRTMNLVTYTSLVSIRPRYYALGLYRGTLSWENMLETGEGVLQVRH